MKNIHQLIKAARRIPRIIARANKTLMKRGLTPGQVAHARQNIVGARMAQQLLAKEIHDRNINGPAFRDATPHKKRRSAAAPQTMLAAA